MPRILRSQGIYYLGKYVPAAPVAVFIAPPIQTRLVAVQNRLLSPYRRTQVDLRPPAIVAPTPLALPDLVRIVRTRPRDTTYVLGKPTTLRVFAGPTSRLTRARPRPTTHVLRPAAVVLVPHVEQQLRTLRVRLVRGRPGKTRYLLRPAVVVLNPGVEQRIRTLRTRTVRTRPRRTVARLFPPAVVAAAAAATFKGPRSVLVHTRPVRTTVLLGRTPLVEIEVIQLTIRVVETKARPRATTASLFPPAVVATAVFFGPRSILVKTRPRRTIHVLSRPAVVGAAVTFVAPPFRVAFTRIRPRPTTTVLFPPAVVAPRPLAAPPTSRLVRTRPRHTVYRLEPPTVLTVFPGPRSELTKARPRPTTTVLVPAQVVLNPGVEQELRTLRVALVRARPQPTTTLLRPPAVITINPPVVTDLRVLNTPGRRPKTLARLFRPATLEPFSIQLDEQTIRVQLVRVRPRKTLLKLRPPTVTAVLTFYTGKPVLVRARPRHTVTTLGEPTALRVFETGLTALVRTRPRHTVATLRPPAVVRQPPEVTDLRVALVRARPRHTITVLRPPAAILVPSVEQQRRTLRSRIVRGRRPVTHAYLHPPAVVTPFRPPVVTQIRFHAAEPIPRRFVHTYLYPPQVIQPVVPGTACLTDQLANAGCLTDQFADRACLDDVAQEAVATLTHQLADSGCLVDMSAAKATLQPEE